jgi:hypothetical protein
MKNMISLSYKIRDFNADMEDTECVIKSKRESSEYLKKLSLNTSVKYLNILSMIF